MKNLNLLYAFVLTCGVPLSALAASAQTAQPDDASLRAADAEEVRIIAAGDTKAMREFMHPNYIVNSPANRIVRKDDLIKLLAAGRIANDGLEQTVEETAITGNVGVVMGHESIKPKPDSELGDLYGAKTLERRFTDIFLFENGKWRILARQSTVIQPTRGNDVRN